MITDKHVHLEFTGNKWMTLNESFSFGQVIKIQDINYRIIEITEQGESHSHLKKAIIKLEKID